MKHKIIGLSLSTGLILLILYLIVFQQLVNEVSVLQNVRCTSIDPLIEKKNQIGATLSKTLTASPSGEIARQQTKEYQNVLKGYIATTGQWFKKLNVFLDRWDAKIFTASRFGEVYLLLFRKYQVDFQSNQAALDLLNEGSSTISQEKRKQFVQLTILKVELDKEMKEKIKNLKQWPDWRLWVVKIPASQCSDTEDNLSSRPIALMGN